jgi:crotonobetainyl-CoA:carnitine CoA-transferase CaiB-like acyl-CoA transferase
VVNSPVKLSRTPVQVERGADSPGGHTRTILTQVLGYDDSKVDGLIESGAIREA